MGVYAEALDVCSCGDEILILEQVVGASILLKNDDHMLD
jgi:hypothetical protein